MGVDPGGTGDSPPPQKKKIGVERHYYRCPPKFLLVMCIVHTIL